MEIDKFHRNLSIVFDEEWQKHTRFKIFEQKATSMDTSTRDEKSRIVVK